MRAARLLGLVSILALEGCPSPGERGASAPTVYYRTVGKQGTTPQGTLRSSVIASHPQPGTCPATAPVDCPGWCCPAGMVCTSTSCAARPAGSCPPTEPVACSAPPTCEATGCIAYDASPAHNGATVPASAWTAGRFGSGLALPTTCTSLATAPTVGFPTGSAPFTAEAWLDLSGANDWPQVVLEYGGGAPMVDTGFELEVARGSVGFFEEQLSVPCSLAFPTSVAGAWHLITVTYDGATVAAYLDGAALGTCSVGALTMGGSQLAIGSTALPPTGCAEPGGSLDEVRLLSFAQSASQVAADAATAAAFTAINGTVGLWHFDEGASLRCCPAGSTCGADGSCVAPGGSGVPGCAGVDCGNGLCCPAGSTCGANGCTVPVAGAPLCPAAAPVACANGTCCPTGFACGTSSCEEPVTPVTTQPQPVCPSGTTDAIADDGSHVCCPSVSGGEYLSTPLSMSSGGVPQSCVAPGTTIVCASTDSSGHLCGTCSPGYSCCNIDSLSSSCVASATAQACPNSGTPCNTSNNVAGCCPAGTTCGGGGCLPSDLIQCYTFGACPAGTTCVANGSGATCDVPPVPVACWSGEAACGAGCCPSGTACADDACVAAAPTPACPSDFPVWCDASTATCCPAGTLCGQGGECVVPTAAGMCDASHPSPCGTGGVCCAASATCAADGSCVLASSPPMRNGPQGPPCGNGVYCDAGEVCGSTQCCPAATPVECGGVCCTQSAGCEADGLCGCEPSETLCGAFCCAAGDSCVNGHCMTPCSDPTAPTPCGDVCCSSGVACADPTNSDCACPADAPKPCGDLCCGPKAACDSSGDCVCESGVPCGNVCCAAGQVCTSGTCETPPPAPTCSGNDHWEPACNDCCAQGFTCCRAFGQLECSPPAYCD